MRWNRGQGTGRTPAPSSVPTAGPLSAFRRTSAGLVATGSQSAPTKASTPPWPPKAGEGFLTRWCWWCEVSWTSYEQVCWMCDRTDGAMKSQPFHGNAKRWRAEQGRS